MMTNLTHLQNSITAEAPLLHNHLSTETSASPKHLCCTTTSLQRPVPPPSTSATQPPLYRDQSLPTSTYAAQPPLYRDQCLPQSTSATQPPPYRDQCLPQAPPLHNHLPTETSVSPQAPLLHNYLSTETSASPKLPIHNRSAKYVAHAPGEELILPLVSVVEALPVYSHTVQTSLQYGGLRHNRDTPYMTSPVSMSAYIPKWDCYPCMCVQWFRGF